MTVADKYGFTFHSLPRSSSIVERFLAEHLRSHNYPADLQPSSESWMGVSFGPTFYCVFGWRRLPRAIDIPDFYTSPGRWGIMAGYAAMERIKADADEQRLCVVTVTPYRNTRMVDAYKHVFDVKDPSHVVFMYDPVGTVAHTTETVREEVHSGC
jgi:hypothetical protein